MFECNTPLPEVLLGEPFFCLMACRHSFIHGKMCLATAGLGGSEEDDDDTEDEAEDDAEDDLLGPALEAETEEDEAPPPGCWAPLLPGGSGGDTGQCSGGRPGRMQLPFSSLFLASCWWCPPPPPPLVPSDCSEHAERWYESTSRWAAGWKAGWWWDTGTGAS